VCNSEGNKVTDWPRELGVQVGGKVRSMMTGGKGGGGGLALGAGRS